MAIERKKDAHIWERDPYDWYVEPQECSLALFDNEEFHGEIWDPACGLGRIVESARASGLSSWGSDIVVRSEFCSERIDFLASFDRDFTNIVTNPPFKHAEEFVRRSLEALPNRGKAAFLLPTVWMAGFSTKRGWLPTSPLLSVYSISPRPSMPPGRVIEAGVRPGNGTKDFAWFVWQKGYQGEARLRFMNTKPYTSRRRSEARKSLCVLPAAE